MFAGEFLNGIMRVSRTAIMLGGEHLVRVINTLFEAADWESFLVMLPHMRGAFEHLHERQRDNLAEMVARRHGLMDAAQITEIGTSMEAGAIIARIDQQVAEIMKHWSFDGNG